MVPLKSIVKTMKLKEKRTFECLFSAKKIKKRKDDYETSGSLIQKGIVGSKSDYFMLNELCKVPFIGAA